MLNLLRWIVKRELLIAFRHKADVATALLFFMVVTSLFPLAVSPERDILRLIGPGVLWVAALLALLPGLDRMFAADYEDGTLEQMLLSVEPLALVVLGKVVAHWMLAGWPLVLLAPLLMLQYDLPAQMLLPLCAGLLLGTGVLSLLGAVGAALGLGLRGRSVLVPILVLPLCVPVLLFGVGAADAVLASMSPAPYLLLLAAMLLAGLALAPPVAAYALRLAA